ncbi:MAG: Crp/Fnr family transcriptional regulator [Zetaproteobacteria bacterium CG12_big_fil_rev_8_21_14_0_65_55_1124]|nr:MAG: Crp/Fnr family transcriptional regulator [Zetaproteobacteria bacterium CG1_02_55_237]PIS19709.1 MAG: Crp/Fnr family transcriptional regulator [Zetaproteobacteria bacterium CG08_land_8_20_14_0_20_55_17]PIW43476.1 MAG: Crp/Fnr family transcriptional regulator [Zetaproteobacteria bacterium CG12_big_fil_rev_8_21_14_0_65_55_1124]PIY54107.1 MAG: Crp/Fnr family transcriptional regulator [Zetaproteobacteria bacterium CG_4_10_14_0_8_um_filter_55_43]PIZ39100.1 MAG: Crp/Fnr family transcriptional 
MGSIMQAFPDLAQLPASIRDELDALPLMQVPGGTVLFRDGDACQGYVFVLSGSVRVQKMDPEGREIVLYRVEDGQTCMLTTSCLLGGRPYPAEGIAEEETELALLSPKRLDALLSDAAFRRFVLSMISLRIADLMALIEDVAFGRMDVRLARRLLELDNGSGELRLTHQQLATELGTAREVISRLLKDFERRRMVTLGRGIVLLPESKELRELAAQQV